MFVFVLIRWNALAFLQENFGALRVARLMTDKHMAEIDAIVGSKPVQCVKRNEGRTHPIPQNCSCRHKGFKCTCLGVRSNLSSARAFLCASAPQCACVLCVSVLVACPPCTFVYLRVRLCISVYVCVSPCVCLV